MPTAIADHREVERPPQEIVSELVRILGAPLVAILGEVRSTCAVREWTRGTSVPDSIDRMRFALHIAMILLQREKPDVVRAWFGGLNPDLDDENPLLLIASRHDVETQRSILRAAQRYISE